MAGGKYDVVVMAEVLNTLTCGIEEGVGLGVKLNVALERDSENRVQLKFTAIACYNDVMLTSVMFLFPKTIKLGDDQKVVCELLVNRFVDQLNQRKKDIDGGASQEAVLFSGKESGDGN